MMKQYYTDKELSTWNQVVDLFTRINKRLNINRFHMCIGKELMRGDVRFDAIEINNGIDFYDKEISYTVDGKKTVLFSLNKSGKRPKREILTEFREMIKLFREVHK